MANKPLFKDLKKLESNSHFSVVFTAPGEAGDLGDLIQMIASTEDHLVPHVSFDHEKKKINLHYPDSVKRKQKQEYVLIVDNGDLLKNFMLHILDHLLEELVLGVLIVVTLGIKVIILKIKKRFY